MNEHVKPQPGDIVVMGNARVDSQHKLFPLGGSRGVVIADVLEELIKQYAENVIVAGITDAAATATSRNAWPTPRKTNWASW